MAKKKGGKAGKGVKLPKEVAGVAVPKALRKAGGKVLAKASSPEGREWIAAGLGLAATLAEAAVARDRSRRPAAAAAKAEPVEGKADAPAPEDGPEMPTKPGAPGTSAIDPHEIGVAIGTVAQQLLGNLLKPKPKP